MTMERTTARATHQADGCSNPWAVVIKPLDTVVIDAAVVGAGGLVKPTGLVVPDYHPMLVYHHLRCPAAENQHRAVMTGHVNYCPIGLYTEQTASHRIP